MQKRCYNVMRLAGIPANRQRQPVHLLPIITATVVLHNRRGHAQITMLCIYSLSCWQSLGQQWILIPYPPTRSQSNGLAHRVGTRDIVWHWLLCLFSCTFPAPLVPRVLNAAQLPPTSWVCPNLPFLFFSLRSSSVFDLCLDCLGSRQPGRTQGVGLLPGTERPTNAPSPPPPPRPFGVKRKLSESSN
jgi:hypothetical protein